MSTAELRKALILRLETYDNADFLEAVLNYISNEFDPSDIEDLIKNQSELIDMGLADMAVGNEVDDADVHAKIEAWLAE